MGRRGKPETFTPEQQGALRAALKEWIAEQRGAGVHLTQEGIGELLGVVQQTAGRFLAHEGTGVSYASATKIARLTGAAGVDEFFAKRGLSVEGPSRTSAAVAAVRHAERELEGAWDRLVAMEGTMRDLIAEMRRVSDRQDRIEEAVKAMGPGESGTVRVRSSAPPSRHHKRRR